MFILKIAWRYAHSRIVNYIAIFAIALCLTVQIVVMAVLDGMLVEMEERVRSTGQQITLIFRDAYPDEFDLQRANLAATKIEGVKGISPLVVQYGLGECNDWYGLVEVHGIDLAAQIKYSNLADYLLDKKLDPKDPKWFEEESIHPGAFVSTRVAEKLGATVGDSIMIHFTNELGSKDLKGKKFIIASTFLTGNPFLDETGIYIPIESAREMFLETTDQSIQQFSVWLDDPKQADALSESVTRSIVGAIKRNPKMNISYFTWTRQWRMWYEGMVHENNLQEIVLGLMNLSAGFCVFAIMATLVSGRGRDIGLMRCLGAGRIKMASVFVVTGLILGIAGALLGVGAGYFCTPRIDSWFQAITGSPMYPPRMFGVEDLKTVIYPAKVAIYTSGAVIISVIASLYPAIWACLREPMEALRDE